MTKQLLLVLASGVVVIVSAAAAGVGDVAPVDVGKIRPLSYQQLTADDAAFADAAPGCGTVNPNAVVATLNAGATTIFAAVDSREADSPAPDVLRLDFSGRGMFTTGPVIPLNVSVYPSTIARTRGGNAEIIRTTSTSARGEPGIVILERNGESLPVWIEARYSKRNMGGRSTRQLSLSIITVREGQCDFSGKTHRIRLVDGNNNLAVNDLGRVGRHDGHAAVVQLGDTIHVDVGDGTFTAGPAKAVYGHPVSVDGRWYTVTISNDQKTVRATPLTDKTGWVQIDIDKHWMKLISDDRVIVWDGTRKPMAVPAGTYEIASAGTILGTNPERGVIIAHNRDCEPVMLTVESGKTVHVATGSPITLEVDVTVSGGREVKMTLARRDAAGLPLKTLVLAGRMPPRSKPTFRVTDAAGTIVHAGPFEYG